MEYSKLSIKIMLMLVLLNIININTHIIITITLIWYCNFIIIPLPSTNKQSNILQIGFNETFIKSNSLCKISELNHEA